MTFFQFLRGANSTKIQILRNGRPKSYFPVETRDFACFDCQIVENRQKEPKFVKKSFSGAPIGGQKTVRLTIQGAERKNPKNSCRLQWI